MEALKKWDGGCPPPRMEYGEGACCRGPGVTSPENFRKYQCKSVQYGAFLATSATENVQLSV